MSDVDEEPRSAVFEERAARFVEEVWIRNGPITARDEDGTRPGPVSCDGCGVSMRSAPERLFKRWLVRGVPRGEAPRSLAFTCPDCQKVPELAERAERVALAEADERDSGEESAA